MGIPPLGDVGPIQPPQNEEPPEGGGGGGHGNPHQMLHKVGQMMEGLGKAFGFGGGGG